MKQPPPPRSSDDPKPAPEGIAQAAPVDRAGRSPVPEPPRQKGGAVDKGSAAAQVPGDDASLSPDSGDKLGGGPGGH
jgi:hypothetical protein